MAQSAWMTRDEITVIRYIASNKRRPSGRVPTLKERRNTLSQYVRLIDKREWPDGINVTKVRVVAERFLRNMG